MWIIGLGLGLGFRLAGLTLGGGGGSPPSWILTTGAWNDGGVWDDAALWKDAP